MSDLLEALAVRVEAGDLPAYDLCAELAKALLPSEFTRDHVIGPEWVYQYADKSWGPMRQFTTSLDAAQALHDTVLPGWAWARMTNGMFMVAQPYDKPSSWHNIHEGLAPTPAASWVAAILRAVHSAKENDDD